MKKAALLSVFLLLALAPYGSSACGDVDIIDEYTNPFSVGVFGSFALTPCCGTPGYTFSIYSGTLPAGLTLSSSGVISGTPTAVDTQLVCFTVTDSQGCHVTKCLYVYVQ